MTKPSRRQHANVPSSRTGDVSPRTLGFGVPATSDPHHFKVMIPRSNAGPVQISEHLGMQARPADEHASSTGCCWTAPLDGDPLRSAARFQRPAQGHGLKPSAWKVGDNPVDRLAGKRSSACPGLGGRAHGAGEDPVAVRNWLALRPEERWWLFGMTAMSTGGIGDGDKGLAACLAPRAG